MNFKVMKMFVFLPVEWIGAGASHIKVPGASYDSVLIYPYSFRMNQREFKKREGQSVIIYSSQLVLCVQEVVTPFYIVTHYIKWSNYFLDTR